MRHDMLVCVQHKMLAVIRAGVGPSFYVYTE